MPYMSSSFSNAKQLTLAPVMREVPHASRLVFDLNSGVRFHRCEQPIATNGDGLPPSDPHSWELVNLPHAARLEPVQASGGRNFQGVCWYFRELELPDDWRDR